MDAAPWDGDGWNDMHFKKMETAHLIATANKKIMQAIGGYDPEANALNPRWDVTTSFQAPVTRPLNSMRPASRLHGANRRANGNIKSLPSGAPTLVERERQFMKAERRRKAETKEVKRNQFEEANRKAVAAASRTYTRDDLTAYLNATGDQVQV
jgi:hypothetical protein